MHFSKQLDRKHMMLTLILISLCGYSYISVFLGFERLACVWSQDIWAEIKIMKSLDMHKCNILYSN